MLAILRVAALSLLTLVPAIASAQPQGPAVSPLWARAVGNNDVDADEVDGVGVDNAGNVAIAGVFQNTLDLGGGAWTAGGRDAFVASYDPLGRLRWARQVGSTGTDNIYDLDVDASGNIVVSGEFSGTINLGGTNLTSAGGTDMFIARYNSAGVLQCALRLGGTADDGGNEVVVTSAGEIAVSGMSGGPFNAGSFNFAAGGNTDAYVVRINTACVVQWVVPANGPGNEFLRAMAINDDGVVLAGYDYQGSLNLPGGTLTGVAGKDGAVIRIAPTGSISWRLNTAGPGDDYVRGVAPGPAGAVFVSGMATGNVSVGGQAFTFSEPDGEDWIVRLSSTGVAQWGLQITGAGRSLGAELDSWPGGMLLSTSADGPVVARQAGVVVGRYGSARGGRRSLLLAVDADGVVGESFLAVPAARSATTGGTVGVSPNGLYGVQNLRFGGTIRLGGMVLTTPSIEDAVVVALRLPALP